jgi:hypothetical protein
MKSILSMNVTSLSDVISELFRRAEEEEIPYCILRNYTELPESTLGGDIDLIISPRTSKSWDILLHEISDSFELSLGVIQVHYHGVRYCIFNLDFGLFLKLDVHYGEFWRGVEYFSASEIIGNRVRYKEFFVPSLADEAVLSLLAPLITGGAPKRKYEHHIIGCVRDNKVEFVNGLTLVIGRKLANEIVDFIYCRQFMEISKLSTRVKASLWVRMFSRSICKGFLGFFRYLHYEIRRRVNPIGYLVVLDGPTVDILRFVNLFIDITKEEFPGLSVNGDCIIKRGECITPDELLKSYNFVVCSPESLIGKKKMGVFAGGKARCVSFSSCGNAVVSNRLLNYNEAIYELYKPLLNVYAEKYKSMKLK